MSIARQLSHLTQDLLTPASIKEAEIREELEFHLEMRTRDNLSAGMAQEDARNNARDRFGDFDRNFQACRRAALGWRLWLQRVQLMITLTLGIAVIWLGSALFRAKAAYESELNAMRRQVRSLQPLDAVSGIAASNDIPVRQWALSMDYCWEPAQQPVNEELVARFEPDTLAMAWSNWEALGMDVQ